MSIPIGRCRSYRFFHLLPGFKAMPFEGQGAQDLPPRLNQIQVGGVGGLEHEFPTRMSQIEE